MVSHITRTTPPNALPPRRADSTVDRQDVRAAFRLLPASAATGSVADKALLRIQHVISGVFLHTSNKHLDNRQEVISWKQGAAYSHATASGRLASRQWQMLRLCDVCILMTLFNPKAHNLCYFVPTLTAPSSAVCICVSITFDFPFSCDYFFKLLHPRILKLQL